MRSNSKPRIWRAVRLTFREDSSNPTREMHRVEAPSAEKVRDQLPERDGKTALMVYNQEGNLCYQSAWLQARKSRKNPDIKAMLRWYTGQAQTSVAEPATRPPAAPSPTATRSLRAKTATLPAQPVNLPSERAVLWTPPVRSPVPATKYQAVYDPDVYGPLKFYVGVSPGKWNRYPTANEAVEAAQKKYQRDLMRHQAITNALGTPTGETSRFYVFYPQDGAKAKDYPAFILSPTQQPFDKNQPYTADDIWRWLDRADLLALKVKLVWFHRMLLRQTEDERMVKRSRHLNAIGFTGPGAKMAAGIERAFRSATNGTGDVAQIPELQVVELNYDLSYLLQDYANTQLVELANAAAQEKSRMLRTNPRRY